MPDEPDTVVVFAPMPVLTVTVRSVPVSSRNGAYVHDRRSGEREVVADAPGSPLARHERDSLYELTLAGRIELRPWR